MKNTKIFRANKAGRSISYRVAISSAHHPETLRELSRLTGVELRTIRQNYKETLSLQIWGDELHELIRQLWPYLLKPRQHEYAAIRKASEASIIEGSSQLDGDRNRGSVEG